MDAVSKFYLFMDGDFIEADSPESMRVAFYLLDGTGEYVMLPLMGHHPQCAKTRTKPRTRARGVSDPLLQPSMEVPEEVVVREDE